MELTIFGPNLSGVHQRKGQMHVHATGCGDCRKYGRDEAEKLETTTRRDVVEMVYADQMSESDAPYSDYENDFFWAPCVRSLTH
jgi:hypothetical protein